MLSFNRWYLSYPLSYRHIEEMIEERGIDVDHSTINRGGIETIHMIHKSQMKQGVEQHQTFAHQFYSLAA